MHSHWFKFCTAVSLCQIKFTGSPKELKERKYINDEEDDYANLAWKRVGFHLKMGYTKDEQRQQLWSYLTSKGDVKSVRRKNEKSATPHDICGLCVEFSHGWERQIARCWYHLGIIRKLGLPGMSVSKSTG